MSKLNPPRLDEYIGQGRVKANIRTIVNSLEGQCFLDDPMDHMLLCGPPGLGKTSLAELIATEVQGPIIKFMGPQLRDVDSLSVLQDTEPWTFVFIDEIHALPSKVEEALYEPMDEFRWKGSKINSFTLIGATTKEGLLSKPLRSRFTIAETLTLYSVEDLIKIVNRSATILKLSIDDKASEMIAQRSRGTPRIANQLLKRVSYYSKIIDSNCVQIAMDNIGVDQFGLEMLDRNILSTISKSFGGGPVGIDSLATVVNEDVATIEAREPYLVTVGFVQRTGKGRVLTASGIDYVKDIKRNA
jgi:Holliday junction DNA helicase RuvB